LLIAHVMSHDTDRPHTHFVSIPGWPVIAPGLLMTTVDNVVFMHLDGGMPDASYALYLRALEASLGHRSRDGRVAVVYDIPTFSGLRAMSARAAGDVFNRYRETLRETTACFVLVSPSLLARVAVETVFAVSRLPFPKRTLPSLGSALAYAATFLPEIDPRSVERRIADELGRHGRRVRG
jgi:hypothetical protein